MDNDNVDIMRELIAKQSKLIEKQEELIELLTWQRDSYKYECIRNSMKSTGKSDLVGIDEAWNLAQDIQRERLVNYYNKIDDDILNGPGGSVMDDDEAYGAGEEIDAITFEMEELRETAEWLLTEARKERDVFALRIIKLEEYLYDARLVLRRIRPDPPESEEYFT